MRLGRLRGGRLRTVAAGAATVAVLGPLAWLWQASLLPEVYSPMSVGYPDYGGGPAGTPGGAAHERHAAHGAHAAHMLGGASVADLVPDPARPADIAVTLTARKQRFRLASGHVVDGYTLNGESPGPVIRATAGQLVQVRLVNESVPAGVTLHWHGVDVPNAEDGAAGVTQDAVRVGAEYTYRFVANQTGTFWYHSHQVSHEQVQGGLFGALVITPPTRPAGVVDVVAVAHLYQGVRTVNGRVGEQRVEVPPGGQARVRIINTDNGALAAWVTGAPFRLVAIDGTDLVGPTPVRDAAIPVTAGARTDLLVTMPDDGSPVRVQLGGPVSVALGSRSFDIPAVSRPAASIDPLAYGTRAPVGFNPDRPNRRFEYVIGRRPGFLDGRPGMWWTINGHLFPDVPMFVVAHGDVVRMHITNRSGQAHPMHLHGHHAVVLARNGVPATGSPWWVDSLDVRNGESYDIAFLADNPGIWMDHCHNLPHAAQGLVAHLIYQGVTTPYMVGDGSGNQPE